MATVKAGAAAARPAHHDNFLSRGGSSSRAGGRPVVPKWARPQSAPAKRAPQRAPGRIPGYTGYVPHSHAIAGRSYGRATRRALKHDIRTLLVSDLIPSDPQTSTKLVRRHRPSSASMVRRGENPSPYMPGYTGFIPETKTTFGVTYGHAANSSLSHRRSRPQSAKSSRKAMNAASLHRVSHPVRWERPKLHAIDSLHSKHRGIGPQPGKAALVW